MTTTGRDTLGDYLERLAHIPTPTHPQQTQWAKRIEAGVLAAAELNNPHHNTAHDPDLAWLAADGTRAKHEMVKANLRLVVSIAKQFKSPQVPLVDLVQEGNLGLMRAIEMFDHKRGYTFSTYATNWIKQAIRRALHQTGTMIRVPTSFRERLWKARRLLEQRNQNLRDIHKLYPNGIPELDFTARDVQLAAQSFRDHTSYDHLCETLGTDRWQIGLAPWEQPEDSLDIDPTTVPFLLGYIETMLSERSADIIRRLHGLHPYHDPQPLADAAAAHRISPTRAGQIRDEAFAVMRRVLPEFDEDLHRLLSRQPAERAQTMV